MNENQVMLIFIAVITIALVFVGVSSKFNKYCGCYRCTILVSIYGVGSVVTERRLRKSSISLCKKERRMMEDIFEFVGRYMIKPIIRFVRYLVIDIIIECIIEGVINGMRKLRKIRNKMKK